MQTINALSMLPHSASSNQSSWRWRRTAWCFLLFYVAILTTAALPLVEGSAVPPIFANNIRSFAIRRGKEKNGHTKNLDLLEMDNATLQKKGLFGSLLGLIRKHDSGNIADFDPIESVEDSVPSLQQSFPLPSWILMAASGSFGPDRNGGTTKLLKAVLNHPRWLFVGGAVYQGQKALRSEAFRRAARFWVKIGPVVAHYKFTRWWLKQTKAPLEHRDATYAVLHQKYAPITMKVALDLKGLYVKLAQVVSSRPDFVPLEYIRLFVAAQDSLPQWPIEEIKELIDASLQLHEQQNGDGESLSFESVFEDIDDIALGSASIGQCHRATIRGKYARELVKEKSRNSSDDDDDDKEESFFPSVDVAIKVMHPGAEERFRHDFSVFRWLCKVALTGWEPILDELYRQIMSEFDYRREADSLERVRNNMLSSPFSNDVKIPKPVRGLCSKELLVMELLEGPKLSDSLEDELRDILGEERSKELLDRKRLELVLGSEKLRKLDEGRNHSTLPSTEANLLQECSWGTKLRLLGLYTRAKNNIDKLVDVQGYQILRDGVFQGDPHPGNILELTKANKSVAKRLVGGYSSLLGLIDYGQTKIMTKDERLGVAKVIRALGETSENNSQDNTEEVATAMRELGFSTQRNDSKVLAQYAGLFFDSDEVGKKLYDCPTPQTYFKLLTELDPLVEVPDVAIFVARCGFILRGMGSILGKQIKTSQRWSVYAKQALDEAEGKQ